MPERPPNLIRRVLRGIFAVFAAIWMVIEEWIWDRLVTAMKWVARLPVIRRLEAHITKLSPKAAMALFVVPWLLLLPAKILGLWFLSTGHAVLGVLVFLVAKVAGTALLARLFTLTRGSLLQIGWFRRLYEWFTALRDRLYQYVKSLRAYQVTRAWMSAMRTRMRAFWRAMRRLLGRA
jgi:hypothetical protein